MEKYEGNCACGAVHYTFEGEPINAAFCYCTECQRHTGSDKWFGLWIPINQLKFTKGSPLSFTRLGDSGKEMHHKFCGVCSTTLCIEVTVANFYSVSASTINNKDDLSPKMAIYTASAPTWAVFPAGIPKFDTLPPHLTS